jgi:deoxyribose-phosphate aldolase
MYKNNNLIDYTLLENNATDQDILNLCEKADKLQVKSVCVLPKHVRLAKDALINSNVLVCTVVSFPSGQNSIEDKIAETNQTILDGADEVDMVLNYSKLIDTEDTEQGYLINEVKSLVDICHLSTNKSGGPITLKVIVESGLLTEEETKTATGICLLAGADFIKTSTGKVSVGAEPNKIQIMFDQIKSNQSDMKIKASGGVRTAEQIESMLDQVDRFGMGYASVDKLNGIEPDVESNY